MFSKDDNIWKIKFEGEKPLNETDELDEISRLIIFDLYCRNYCTANGDIIF